MAERAIRIKIGASVDRSLVTVFSDLESAAKKARATIANEMAGISRDAAGRMRDTKSRVVGDFDAIAREAMGVAPAIKAPLVKAVDDILKESRAKFSSVRSEFRLLSREATDELGRIERAVRNAERAGQGGVGRFIRGQTRVTGAGLDSAFATVGRPTMRAARAAFGVAQNIGMDLARGIGVQTDLTSFFQQGVSLESMATTLSNQAFMPGASGPNGGRINPGEIVRQVRSAATATAMDPSKTMEGLQAFVGKTGDLETGRQILKDMAVLSRATGANMEDVVDAAGDVANNLGDVKDKGAVVAGVMRAIAGQGKVGAVEMKDFASQMAKVASAASQFSGDKSRNIAILGALAQESRAKGGSASATQAASSVAAFAATFGKGARLDAFKAFGVDVTDKNGQLLDPQQIIMRSLQAAGATRFGGMQSFDKNLGNMIGSQAGLRAVKGFANVYQETYAAAQGSETERAAAATKAVADEFERLIQAQMKVEETNESFARSMNTTEARVQTFNNQMSETADRIRSTLLPAFEALAPHLLRAAEGLAKFTTWLTGDQNRQEINSEFDAMNVASRGRAIVRAASPHRNAQGRVVQARTEISEHFFDEEAAAEKVLQSAYDAKKAEHDKEGGYVGVSREELVKQSKSSDQLTAENAQKELLDRSQLDRMAQELSEMKENTKKLQELMADGIVIKRMPTLGPQAPNNPAVRTGP